MSMFADPQVSGDERLSVRISGRTRGVIDDIKGWFNYRSDADVIRHALGTQHRIGESVSRGERIFVGDKDGKIIKELVFVGPT